jgi:hypothetical protein
MPGWRYDTTAGIDIIDSDSSEGKIDEVDGVSGADAVLDPVGDCAQQVVACGVAKAVVDHSKSSPVSGSRMAMSATVTRSRRFSSSRVN